MRISLRIAVASVAVLTMSAMTAAAQTTPAPVTAGWQDGFVLQTSTGDYRLLLGLTAQTDGRFVLDDSAPATNTFTIRKARPTLSGRVAKYFDFKVMPDFGNGTPTLLDAYVDVRFSPAFRLRTGKDKTPIGYELLMGDSYLLFPERALASSLVPSRDIGVQAQGDLLAGKLTYAAGIFNGIPDGTSSSADADTNNAKDVAGRVVVLPFKSAKSGALTGLGVSVGGSIGQENGPLPSFKTSAGQTYFSYGSSASADGRRDRVTPAVFYYYNSIGAFAEYIRSAQPVSKAGVRTDVANHGWEVTGSIVMTGEAASDRGVRPAKPFDPAAGQWGALQLIARVSTLTVDPVAFTGGLAAANASRNATSFAIGADWYPTAFIKYYLTFERTTFGAGATGTRPAEHLVLFRTQLSF